MVSLAAPATTIKWIAPFPRWNASGPTSQQPFVAEFTEDSFMSDFLNMMAGKVPLDMNVPQQNIGDQTNVLYKFFQPLHQRYYLVTASLVCRQLGMPDREIDRKNGEKTSFVLRRIATTNNPDGTTTVTEYGWVQFSSQAGADNLKPHWEPLPVDNKSRLQNPFVLLDNEERLPLHPAKYCPFVPPSTGIAGTQSQPCDSRTVYNGYIPADQREKYLVPLPRLAIMQFIATSGVDPRFDEISKSVIETWRALYIDPRTNQQPSADHDLLKLPSPPASNQPEYDRKLQLRQQMSLYLILDLAEFLNAYLNDVFKAITANGPAPTIASHQSLLTLLNGTMIVSSAGSISLAKAISDLQNSATLTLAENEPPGATYDIANATYSGGPVDLNAAGHSNFLDLPDAPKQPIPPPPPQPAPGTALPNEGPLHQWFREALRDSSASFQIDDDVARLVKKEPAQGDVFVARLVYERGQCDPIISDASPRFTFAKIFDPDAPARKIRIEMPSIKLKDLRKYKRGVGFQLSPQFNNLLNRVNPGMLTGKGLLDTGAPLGLAMICTFSIPIITICAMIVMFIFLILLNFIFWWLPFIYICFPEPE